MPFPDKLIERHGTKVMVSHITSVVYGSTDHDEIDWDSSTKTQTETYMLIRDNVGDISFLPPGWNNQTDLIAFFGSDISISAGTGAEGDIVEILEGERLGENFFIAKVIKERFGKQKVFLKAAVGEDYV